LLIDADNLSLDGMKEALQQLEAQHRVSLRRAYGSHETLGTVREFLHRKAVRAIVNQGKGTTDAALVVDAMDLLHAGCLPGLVAIGSGDADFAPLAVRLREAGIRVICFAQRPKAGDGLDLVYDEVIFVDSPAPAPAKSPPAAKKAPAKKAAAKRTPAAPPAPPVDPVAQQVHAVLYANADLVAGRAIELNAVVKKLRDDKLMAKSTSARNFFKKHAPEVELIPDRQPNQLRLIRKA
jgi:hypothetical protein